MTMPKILASTFAVLIACACFADQHVGYPTPKDTVSAQTMKKMVSRHGGAAYPNDRVISPPSPISVRQNHPDGPTYQEGIGYTFLIHSMKRPRITRLDSGRLVLLATAWLQKQNEERTFIITSDDEGGSWSQPRELGVFGQLVNLGGDKVAAIGSSCSFSDDAGETWSEAQRLLLPDGKPSWYHGSVAFDGKRLAAISYYEGAKRPPVAWSAYSVLRFSDDLGRTWSDPIDLPTDWQTSEGALTYAHDGALVAALRTGPRPVLLDSLAGRSDDLVGYNDHWRRITTARSTDGGKTWTHYQVHFRYGKTHSELLTLTNGDILLTYAARMGDLDGYLYHGVEGVLSHDNGKTWDWENRFILHRWPMHQSMHSPVSVQLSDGRIFTVWLYTYDAPWGKGTHGLQNLGLVNGLFWNPHPRRK